MTRMLRRVNLLSCSYFSTSAVSGSNPDGNMGSSAGGRRESGRRIAKARLISRGG
jgi:hypothetical protein